MCGEAQVFCTPHGSFAQGWGDVEGNEVVLHTSKASVFNLMVVAVRKDPAALEEMALGEEYEEPVEREDPEMVVSTDEEEGETAEL